MDRISEADSVTIGTVISVKKQWWLKINKTPLRCIAWAKADFPFVIKVRYAVGGNVYTKRKWIGAGGSIPVIGNNVSIHYCADRLRKAKVQ